MRHLLIGAQVYLSLVIVLLVCGGPRPCIAASRKQCRIACADEIAACRAQATSRRERHRCRPRWMRTCRQTGLAACEPPQTTTTTIPDTSTTTTTLTSDGSTTTTTTTTTTLPPTHYTCFDTYPICNGTCPPGYTCVDYGPYCECEHPPATTTTTIGPPTLPPRNYNVTICISGTVSLPCTPLGTFPISQLAAFEQAMQSTISQFLASGGAQGCSIGAGQATAAGGGVDVRFSATCTDPSGASASETVVLEVRPSTTTTSSTLP